MKKYIIATICFAFAVNAGAQLTGKLFQATLRPGSTLNSVKVYIKPSASFTGNFSNLQFTLQVPNTVVPKPAVTIKSNSLSTYIPTASYLTENINEAGFYTYIFAAVAVGSPQYSFTAGTEIEALELQLMGQQASTGVRLASLPNGGITQQAYFYIEVNGNDNTNFTSMFYQSTAGNVPVNGGSYETYSYVSYSPVILPVKFTSFTVQKEQGHAVLKWTIENTSDANRYFSIERSENGTVFTQIKKLNIINSRINNLTYSFIDSSFAQVTIKGFCYYRIKQVDNDGHYVYSPIRLVSAGEKKFSLSIFGNPSNSDVLNLVMQSVKDGRGSFRMFSTEGKLVYQGELVWGKGLTERSVSIRGLPSGQYMATLLADNNIYTLLFIR